MKKGNSKYFFLYLKTGGGHLAPARSLSKHIEKYYPGSVEPVLIDGFEKTPRIIRYLIEDGYRKLQSGAKWYYEFLYAINKVPVLASITAGIITFFCRKYIEEIILKEKPEKIIILHFFLIQPVYRALRKYNLKTKVFTIVTDPYTAHPLWFLEKEQNFIVFSERLKKYVNEKMPDSRVNVFPFILDEKFSTQLPQENIGMLKKKLGFPADKKIVLVLGGGDGIPHGKKILEEILKSKPDAVIAVVAGRNKQLFRAASKLKNDYGNCDLIVYGFVDFIYELLNISDVVVTKCGASTMMEILMIKKVPVVNDYIWEQEKGNIEFLMDNKFGIYEPVIKNLPAVIKKLINEEAYYNSFRDNIINANLKNGTAEVSAFLLNEQ
ncbi:MAG: hypothetical protein R6W90_06345 [Ignavibacteriaceae bacterium]